MIKNNDLVSSNALFRAEKPKSYAIPANIKPSLNSDVEAWVAAGGQIKDVTGVQCKDFTMVSASNVQQRVLNGLKSKAMVLGIAQKLGEFKLCDIAGLIKSIGKDAIGIYLRQLKAEGVIESEYIKGDLWYRVTK